MATFMLLLTGDNALLSSPTPCRSGFAGKLRVSAGFAGSSETRFFKNSASEGGALEFLPNGGAEAMLDAASNLPGCGACFGEHRALAGSSDTICSDAASNLPGCGTCFGEHRALA